MSLECVALYFCVVMILKSVSVTACVCMFICWLYVYVYPYETVVVLTYIGGSSVFEKLPSDCSKSNFCTFLTEIRDGFVRSFQ